MSFVTTLFSLTGQIALITGSTSGIGKALAQGLAQAGAHVIINGHVEERAEAVAAQMRADGLKASAAPFDVTDAAALEAGVARIEAEVGPIGILVNNAGIQHREAAQSVSADNWRRVLAVNLDAPFLVAQAVGRAMIARGAGRIINTCSIMSEIARPGVAPYTASKGGIKMLTKALAAEWGPHGITVNGIGPGYIATDLTEVLVKDAEFSRWLAARTPLRRWGTVEDLVGAAIYLASPAAGFVNGHILYVDGGLTASV